jgi:hypothetical protein
MVMLVVQEVVLVMIRLVIEQVVQEQQGKDLRVVMELFLVVAQEQEVVEVVLVEKDKRVFHQPEREMEV